MYKSCTTLIKSCECLSKYKYIKIVYFLNILVIAFTSKHVEICRMFHMI